MNEQQLAYCAIVLRGTLKRPSARGEILLLLAERPLTRSDLIALLGTCAHVGIAKLLKEGLVQRFGYRLWKRCVFFVLTDAGREEAKKLAEPLKKYCVPDSEEFILEEAYHIHDSILKRKANFRINHRLQVRYGDGLLIQAYPRKKTEEDKIKKNEPSGKKAPLIPENHAQKKIPRIRQPLIRKKSRRKSTKKS